jgi:hypothetical protein
MRFASHRGDWQGTENMSDARYNSRQPMQKIIRIVIALSILAGTGQLLAATRWDAPTAKLASQITALTGPGNVALAFRNLSSLSPSEVAAIRVPLETQLRAGGVQLRNASNSTAAIQVTLSENVREWLIVAEVGNGAETKVVMVGVDKDSAGVRAGSAMVLRKSFLMSQGEPILDAAIIDSASAHSLLLLSRSVVGVYAWTTGRWNLQQSFPITHGMPFPADLRGRIVAAQSHLFDLYLPGVGCSSSATAPLTMSCRDTDDPWPLGGQKAFFNSARNYFTGILVPGVGAQLPPFFSAATLPRVNYTLWLLIGIDGQVRVYDSVELRTIPNTRDWGSDVVSLKSACGAGTQLLVSAAGDDTVADSLHAYEMVDREPNEVAAQLAMDGPITALWPSADASSATAVVRNLQTGQYDAYNITIACNQ